MNRRSTKPTVVPAPRNPWEADQRLQAAKNAHADALAAVTRAQALVAQTQTKIDEAQKHVDHFADLKAHGYAMGEQLLGKEFMREFRAGREAPGGLCQLQEPVSYEDRKTYNAFILLGLPTQVPPCKIGDFIVSHMHRDCNVNVVSVTWDQSIRMWRVWTPGCGTTHFGGLHSVYRNPALPDVKFIRTSRDSWAHPDTKFAQDALAAGVAQ
jgi:hypothetical protein